MCLVMSFKNSFWIEFGVMCLLMIWEWSYVLNLKNLQKWNKIFKMKNKFFLNIFKYLKEINSKNFKIQFKIQKLKTQNTT